MRAGVEAGEVSGRYRTPGAQAPVIVNVYNPTDAEFVERVYSVLNNRTYPPEVKRYRP